MKLALLFGYISQIYISAIGILLMPIYLSIFGPEGVGLIGLYVMLQAWMPVFDMGLTPVLSREISRFRAGTVSVNEVAERLRTLQFLQGMLGAGLIAAVWLGREWLAREWLSSVSISSEAIAVCIPYAACAVVVRWFSGLLRSVVVGLEHHGLVNGLGAFFASLRFAGVLPVLFLVSNSVDVFFLFQALVGVLEYIAYALIAHRFVPVKTAGWPEISTIFGMLPMVVNMAFLTAVWAVMTQVDKLILSGILSLEEYGYFTLAAMAAGGVLLFVGPLNQVLQPRLTILAEGREEMALAELYCLSSQLIMLGFASLGGGLAFFAEPVMQIWTGNSAVAKAVAPVLFWYGLAYAEVGILLLPFMLQFAKGRLGLHVFGNLILLATLLPALVFAARDWGAIGAGQVFFFAHLLFLLFWVPIIHKNFLPSINPNLLLKDILILFLPMLFVFFVGSEAMPVAASMPVTLAWIAGSVFSAIVFGMALGKYSRRIIRAWFQGAFR